MNPHDFNFANPLWLLALLAIPMMLLIHRKFSRNNSSNLSNFVDPKLLPHILVSAGKYSNNRKAWTTAIVALVLMIVALANPRWSFTDIEAYKPTSSMVILLDLSDSGNVMPARQQIEDLINSSKGLKVGLVAFAGMAHMITPITDDLRTVKTFLPALDTDLVTKQGDNVGAAFAMGQELLAGEPGANKSVLLVSSGVFTDKNYDKYLKQLHSGNVDLYVLGVGDQNKETLQRIAKKGHGFYIAADHSERAVQTILKKVNSKHGTEEIADHKIRQWDDRYYLVLLPAVILFLYLFRQGAFWVVLGFLIMPPAHAAIFKNADQQAAQAFKQGDFTAAAAGFTDNYNKGVALYRAGQFTEAELSFKKDPSIDATYNAGNSQMQQQKWLEAIKSYETVLAAKPDHADAQHNLELARSFVKESAPQVNEETQQQQQEVQSRDQEESQVEKNIGGEEGAEQHPNIEGGLDSEAGQQHQLDDERQEINNMEQQEVDTIKAQEQQEESLDKSNPADNKNDASELWLNRVDSDIKVLLRNKFYIEGALSD